jgi:hypothetical protein
MMRVVNTIMVCLVTNLCLQTACSPRPAMRLEFSGLPEKIGVFHASFLQKVPISPNASYPSASCSKAFTGFTGSQVLCFNYSEREGGGVGGRVEGWGGRGGERQRVRQHLQPGSVFVYSLFRTACHGVGAI